MKTFLATLFISLTLLMGGCASNPGQLQRSEAMFGDGTFYMVEPGYVLTSESALDSRILLGLQHNSDWGDQLFFVVRTEVADAQIPDSDGLVFVIDGERVAVNAPMSISDENARMEAKQASFSAEKSFSSNTGLLKKILAAKEVKVQVDIGRGVVQGNLMIEREKSAIRGLREFAQQTGL